MLFLGHPALGQAEPETVEELVTRGTTRFAAGNTDGAREDAERALKLSSDDFGALVLMGRVLGRNEHWPEAQPYFERALAQRPEDAVALRGKALTLCGLGQRDAARKVLDEALVLHPDDAILYYNRAYVVYHDQDELSPTDIEAALADLKRSQELDPKDPDGWGVSAWIKWAYQEKPALALPDANRAIELGNKAEDYRTRALILIDLGQMDKAVDDLRQGLRVAGHNPELKKDMQDLLDQLAPSKP